MAQVDSSQGLRIGPRSARPDRRIDVLMPLGATFVAAAIYVGALILDIHPPEGLTTAFFAAAPISATFALVVIETRSRAERDASLAWVSAGLAIGIAAMMLQVISFPVVSPEGGIFRTSDDSSATLYLLFHTSLVAGAAAGALSVPLGWRVPSILAGWGLSLLVAANLVPLPELIVGGMVFTPLLRVIELVLAALTIAVTVLWVMRTGRSAALIHAWIGVALSLTVYDIVLNAVGAERLTTVWWASLSLRVATYLVLAFGPVIAVLARLRDAESYGEHELDRRESQLRNWLTVTAGLLSSAEDLSRAVTPAEVADVLSAKARSVAGARYASVLSGRPGERLHLLGADGYDDQQRKELMSTEWDERLPQAFVLRRERPLFLETQLDIRQQFPRVSALPMRDAASLAALPMKVGDETIGVLSVWDTKARAWSTNQRRVLAGLAAQGGQAIARSLAYEEQATAARTLQKSLLPSRLPRPDRLELAARYLPAGHGLLVGGDWYDCVVVDDHRVALVVGDVMGKGLPAAAQMGRIRMAVRSVAALDPSPSSVLRSLDELNIELGTDGIVTLVYVLVDQARGTARIARAGHLPPVLVHPGGTVEFVTSGGSAPVGAPPDDRSETEVALPEGSVLVLYTDGLVEDRVTGLDRGMRRMTEALQRLAPAGHAPGELATRLIRACSVDGGEDDIALLVARYMPDRRTPTVPAQSTGSYSATRL